MQKMQKNYQGFTLIEMTFSLMLLTALLLIVFPSFRHVSQQQQERLLLERIKSVIYMAIEMAVVEKKEIGLRLENKTEIIIFIDKFKNGKIINNRQMILKEGMNLHQGEILIRSFPHYRDYLKFSSGSFQLTDNASLWFCPLGAKWPKWAIFINRQGRVRSLDDARGRIEDSHHQVLECKESRTIFHP